MELMSISLTTIIQAQKEVPHDPSHSYAEYDIVQEQGACLLISRFWVQFQILEKKVDLTEVESIMMAIRENQVREEWGEGDQSVLNPGIGRKLRCTLKEQGESNNVPYI